MKRLVSIVIVLLAAAMPHRSDAAALAPLQVPDEFRLQIGNADGGSIDVVGGLGYTRVVDGTVVASASPTPVELEFGLSSKRALEWVAAFAAGGDSPPLTITQLTTTRAISFELTGFTIREVRIPACDVDALEPANLYVVGRATRLVAAKGTGSRSSAIDARKWVPKNFRLTIPGLHTSSVATFSAIEVQKTASGIAVAPIAVEVHPGAGAASWTSWGEHTLVDGQADKRDGKLELLSVDRAKVLMTIELQGISMLEMTYLGPPRSHRAERYNRYLLQVEKVKIVPAGFPMPKANAKSPKTTPISPKLDPGKLGPTLK